MAAPVVCCAQSWRKLEILGARRFERRCHWSLNVENLVPVKSQFYWIILLFLDQKKWKETKGGFPRRSCRPALHLSKQEKENFSVFLFFPFFTGPCSGSDLGGWRYGKGQIGGGRVGGCPGGGEGGSVSTLKRLRRTNLWYASLVVQIWILTVPTKLICFVGE